MIETLEVSIFKVEFNSDVFLFFEQEFSVIKIRNIRTFNFMAFRVK